MPTWTITYFFVLFCCSVLEMFIRQRNELWKTSWWTTAKDQTYIFFAHPTNVDIYFLRIQLLKSTNVHTIKTCLLCFATVGMIQTPAEHVFCHVVWTNKICVNCMVLQSLMQRHYISSLQLLSRLSFESEITTGK